MRTVEIHLFRHGETDWNKEMRFQGHTDIPLNETGRNQAKDLAHKLRNLGLEAVFSSDLLRAKETAAIATTGLDLPIRYFQELRECHLGQAEGKLREEVLQGFGKETWDRWFSIHPKDWDFGFPGGETQRAHITRAQSILIQTLEKTSYKKIAVSTHGGTVRRLVHASQGAPETAVTIPNGVLYRISLELPSGVFRFIS